MLTCSTAAIALSHWSLGRHSGVFAWSDVGLDEGFVRGTE